MTAPSRCHHHPAVLAEGGCDACQVALCSACSEFTLKQQLCHACAEKSRTAATLRRGAGGLAVAAALVGAGLYSYSAYLDHPINKYGERVEHITGLQSRRAEAPCDHEIAASLATALIGAGVYTEVIDLSQDFDAQCEENPDLRWHAARAYGHLGQVDASVEMDRRVKAHQLGRYAPNVAAYRDAWAIYEQTPCLHRAALKLANRMFALGAHDAVPVLSEHFEAACEPYPRLWWKVHFAHTEQGQWAEAAAIATRLIKYDPTNRDYWLWRGEPRVRLGQLPEAASDFRQSIALMEPSTSRGIAISYLVDIAEAIDRPCDGVMAIQAITEAGGRLEASARASQDRLNTAGDCDPLQGRGAVTVKAPFRGRGAVNGQALSVLVSPDTALVSLRPGLASTLGLVETGETSEAVVVDTFTQGQLAQAETVSLGGAMAASVDVLLTEDVPDGVDVVIGADFLRRFRSAESSEQISLQARRRD